MSTAAVVFARYPEPGRVKTRLTSSFGPRGAAELYAAFLRDALEVLADCHAVRRVVAFTPAERALEMAAFVDDARLELLPQSEGDLGQRMHGAMQACAARGARRTIIVGSDCPGLPHGTLDEALALLERRDLVLGPALDGGYYLIGCAGPPPPAVFENVDWGTAKVMEQTLARLGGASLALLPPWADVDTPADAACLATHLAALALAGTPRARHTRDALARLLPGPRSRPPE